ncbi:MAG: flagellar basal body-associated FliL family protein [Treponemataceae bacterium]|nr:flagellar basal body-associated FliL family protein [Treponemataceae bacterium]
MKHDEANLFLLWLYRILVGITLILVLILGGGTIISLSARVGHTSKEAKEKPVSSSSEVVYFQGLGRMRLTTADTPAAVVVLFIVFPYVPGDRAFVEELSQHIPPMKEIVQDVVHQHTKKELLGKGEETLKKEILSRWNGLFRLGKIQELHFSEFIILE